MQAVLRRIGFYSTSATPGQFAGNLSFQLTDGTNAASAVVSKQVLVAPALAAALETPDLDDRL